MIRCPPRSTLTVPLLPYTTLFRSHTQAEIIDAQDRTVLRTGIPMEAEMEVQRLDGEKVFSMITRFPVLDSVGHVIGIGGIHMNISEIKDRKSTRLNPSH